MPRRVSERVGCSVEVTWEEFGRLTAGHDLVHVMMERSALRVLGKVRGNIVLGELAKGRTPRLVPVKNPA